MTKYIELEALKNRFAKRLVWLKKDIHDEYSLGLYDGCEYDTKLIDEIPAADIAPVQHGWWIWHNKWEPFEFKYECSICHDGSDLESKYCPNCGAKMDGGADNG